MNGQSNWEVDKTVFINYIDTQQKKRKFGSIPSAFDSHLNTLYSSVYQGNFEKIKNLPLKRDLIDSFTVVHDIFVLTDDLSDGLNKNTENIFLGALLYLFEAEQKTFKNIFDATFKYALDYPVFLIAFVNYSKKKNLTLGLAYTFDIFLKTVQYSTEEKEKINEIFMPILNELERLFFDRYQVNLHLSSYIGHDLIELERVVKEDPFYFFKSSKVRDFQIKIESQPDYFLTSNFILLLQSYSCRYLFSEKLVQAFNNFHGLPCKETSVLINLREDFFDYTEEYKLAFVDFLKNWAAKNNGNIELLRSLRKLTFFCRELKYKKKIMKVYKTLHPKTIFSSDSESLLSEVIVNSVQKFSIPSPTDSNKKIKTLLNRFVDAEGIFFKELDYVPDFDTEQLGINPMKLLEYNLVLQKNNIPYQFVEILEGYMYGSYQFSKDYRFLFEAIALISENTFNFIKDRLINPHQTNLDTKTIFNADEFLNINAFAKFCNTGFTDEILPYISAERTKEKSDIPKAIFVVHKVGFFSDNDYHSTLIKDGTIVSICNTEEEAKKIKLENDLNALKSLEGASIYDFYRYTENKSNIINKLKTFFQEHFPTNSIDFFPVINNLQQAQVLLSILDISFHNIICYEKAVDPVDFETKSFDSDCWEA